MGSGDGDGTHLLAMSFGSRMRRPAKSTNPTRNKCIESATVAED